MRQKNKPIRKITLLLVGLICLELILVGSLSSLGWNGTGSTIVLIACVIATLFPLLIAIILLAKDGFRFSLRALLAVVTLVAIFLAVSLKPLFDYRSARIASKQLISANITLKVEIELEQYYASLDLKPPPERTPNQAISLPLWLRPFTENLSAIPPDASVKYIGLKNDKQIQILAKNADRLSSLQSIGIDAGVTNVGLNKLLGILPQFKHLEQIYLYDVSAPADWYRSLNNIRKLSISGPWAVPNTPFPSNILAEISSLNQLEVLDINWPAFNDSDAKTLSSASSLKRIVLRNTAVSENGKSILAKAIPGCFDRRELSP